LSFISNEKKNLTDRKKNKTNENYICMIKHLFSFFIIITNRYQTLDLDLKFCIKTKRKLTLSK